MRATDYVTINQSINQNIREADMIRYEIRV